MKISVLLYFIIICIKGGLLKIVQHEIPESTVKVYNFELIGCYVSLNLLCFSILRYYVS